MANPVTTSRLTPSGRRLEDGHSTKIAFSRDPNVSFWEVSVKPPGMDGGDEINITTMHNTRWRTMVPRALVTLTPMTTTAAYDPNCYDNILNNLLNLEGSVTVHFPDGATLDFFGFLKTFEPNDHTEGEMPNATITIVPTNYDPTNLVEAGPVMTQITGT